MATAQKRRTGHKDGNGQPTPGEDIGLWTGGLLNTDSPPDSVELTVGVVPETPPLPPAEDDPNAAPPTEQSGAAPGAKQEGNEEAATE